MALVDVNSAPYAKLIAVPDIGKVIASQIVEGRPFKDMKDLRNRVKYIGNGREKTLPKFLCFGSHTAPAASDCARPSRREGCAVASRRQSRAAARQQTRESSPTLAPAMVDINSASISELQSLHGIGDVIAQRIVNARPFCRVDDLLGIKGIKHAVLAGFRDRVVVGGCRPQQATRAAQVSPPRLPAAMAASLVRRYVALPGPYDYSDEGETSGEDDCSGDDDEDASSCKTEDTAGDQADATGRRPADEVEVAFAAYRRELREQSEAAAVSYAQWLETQVDLTPTSVPFTAVSAPDSRFPVCCTVDRDVRGFVSRSSQRSPERMPTDHRYRVCAALEPLQRPRPILLASWNVRNVSAKKSTDFLQKIADIINEFDLVALQEVRDEAVLIKLKYLLPPGWAFTRSDPVGQAGGRQEYYAFMYRKSAVEIPTDTWELDSSANVDVLRPPFVATFRSARGSGLPETLELTLVNVHVCFAHIQERHREMDAIRKMADDLGKQLPSERHNVVVLGDFNLPPIEALGGTQSPLAALIRPPLSTTVFGNLYDNLLIDPSTLGRPHRGSVRVDACGVFRMDWRYYPLTKAPGARASTEAVAVERFKCAVELSDHCPVWAALSTAGSITTAPSA